MLGSAAAAFDVMATAAVTAHASRIGQARAKPHADRVRQLSERLEEAIAAAEDRLAVIETDFARTGRPESG